MVKAELAIIFFIIFFHFWVKITGICVIIGPIISSEGFEVELEVIWLFPEPEIVELFVLKLFNPPSFSANKVVVVLIFDGRLGENFVTAIELLLVVLGVSSGISEAFKDDSLALRIDKLNC